MAKEPSSKKVEIEGIDELLAILKKHRKRIGLSQEQLGQFANLSTTSVGEIERGEVDPRFSHLLKMLKLCRLKLYVEPK